MMASPGDFEPRNSMHPRGCWIEGLIFVAVVSLIGAGVWWSCS